MAKKQVEIKPQPEVVYSEKYKCGLTKSKAFFDPAQNSWVSEAIEINLDKKIF